MLCVSALAYADWSDDFSEDPPVIVAPGRNSAALNQDSAAGIYTVENAANTPAFGWVPEGYIAMVNSNNNPRGFGYLVDVGSEPGQIEPGIYEFSANMTWEADSHATLVDVYVLSGNWAVGFRGGPAESSEEGIRSVIAPTDEAALAMKVGSVFLPDGTASTEESPVDITIPNIEVTEGSKVLMFCYFIALGGDGLRVNSLALTGMGPKTLATVPLPENGSTDVLRDVELSWRAGERAVSHDVYLGTVLDDVNEASAADPRGVLVSQGQTDTSYAAGILDFGQTYYWRVDEVNGAPDNTVFKGQLWSFEVEPFSLPVTNITATASSSHDEDMVPARTIDGSGLDELDLHSNEAKDMWLSGMGDPVPSIQYEFDVPYKLHELWVWNSNQGIESFVGLGAKDVTIEISTNGTDWIQLEDVPPFAQAPGKMGYAHNTVIDLGGVVAQHVKLTINAGHGMLPQYGLSEVRFFYIPTQPREPQPDNGATDVAVDTMLKWRAGREAASHQISLSTDPNVVAQGTEAVDATDAQYNPGSLDLAATYYWNVVEVNEAETPSAYTGDTWSFSTQEFIVVDDFEGYNDDCARIFFTWQDGLGHSGSEGIEGCNVAPSNGNGGGSIVGHALAPFAEQGIVHFGSQSMPLAYDDAFGPSETTLALSPAQDWTQNGVKGLALWFAGDPANTGTDLYVKINTTKISYDGPADSLMLPTWQMWYIDLQGVGANLSNVSQLTIGLSSGQGVIFVDDIMLSPHERKQVQPVDPDPANLLAHLAFDGNANDSVGGLHGTLIENAGFDAGQQGQALSLNTVTVTDYVQLTGYKGIEGTSAFSIALWLKTAETIEQQIAYFGTHTGGQRCEFRVHTNGHIRMGNGGGNVEGFTDVTDGTWHHVALTVRENATNSSSDIRIYIDGRDDTRESEDLDPPFDIVPEWDLTIGYRPSQADRFLIGQIDEFYLYDRVLSPAEVAGLAGLTQPFDRP